MAQCASVGSTEALSNSYDYDPLNRVDHITQSGTSVASKFVDYSYDAAGRLTGIDRYAGTLVTDPLVVSAVYTSDDASRLTHLTYSDASAQALADYDWTFDTASRITQAISPDGTATYGYDATEQLTSESYSGAAPADQTFVYDDNGNRTGGGYVTAANNRTTSDGTYTYAFDAEGNRTSRTETATGEVTEYEWDHRNRLITITERASAGGTVLKTVDYSYDPLNRRIAKTVDPDGAGTQSPETSYFIHDGDRASRDGAGDHVVLQLDGSGSITNHYLHGAAVDEILADENAAGDVLWPLTDHLGSVRDLAEHDSSTGATTVASHIVYDAFGNIVSETDATVDHVFGYTGRERDDESDLQFNRARYYDAALGQFIGQDPIGFDAGDANLYRHAGNAPTVSSDPSGLKKPLSRGLLLSDMKVERVPSATIVVPLNGEPTPTDQLPRDKAAPFELFLEKRQELLPYIREFSPFEHASADDPPMLHVYGGQENVIPATDQGNATHHPKFGEMLHERLNDLGVESHFWADDADADNPRYNGWPGVQFFVTDKLLGGGNPPQP